MSDEKIKKAKSGRMVGMILVGFGLFTCVMLFLLFGKMRDAHKVSMSWPEVQGKIESSTIREKEKVNRIGRRGLAVITEYVLEKRIGYEVNGKKYKKVTSWTYASLSEANKYKRRALVGSSVRLHYNPRRPQVAEIHRKKGADPKMGFVFGSMIMFPGFLMYWWNSRKLRKLVPVVEDAPAMEALEKSPTAPASELPQQAPGVELESMKYFDMLSK